MDHFPPGRVPYEQQVAIINLISLAAEKGENALVAAPTGTGKTLAILCAAAAMSHRVYVCSRTHTQVLAHPFGLTLLADAARRCCDIASAMS